MKTTKQLNKYLASASDNRLEIHHGEGYFYYAQTDEEFAKHPMKDVPESEMICYINQGNSDFWKRVLDGAAKAYDDNL
tara:strand:+ start:179 stop:412 length:234 start_codon:yes stop_codon:yes gene_type:complete